MTGPDDKHDADLKAYLDGQDGVSAAYRKVSNEQPPAGLDALILRAAREAVTGKSTERAGSWGKYRIAASFMVGVLVTSFYFNQQDDLTTVRTTAQERFNVPVADSSTAGDGTDAVGKAEEAVVAAQPAALTDAAGLAPADNALLDADTATQAVAVEADAGPARAQALQVAERAQATTIAGAAAQAEGRRVARNAALPPSTTIQAEPVLLGPVNLPPGNRQNAAIGAGTATQSVIRDEAPPPEQLEEITVTGSRIRTLEPDLSYRQTRQEWLDQILSQGRDVIFLVEGLELATTRLEEEMALFSETYPDVDLEAALENLMEE